MTVTPSAWNQTALNIWSKPHAGTTLSRRWETLYLPGRETERLGLMWGQYWAWGAGILDLYVEQYPLDAGGRNHQKRHRYRLLRQPAQIWEGAAHPTCKRGGRLERRAIVVDGPVAYRMRRIQAAREHALGLEILTLPQLAASLAGGFHRLADEETIFPAIATALAGGDFRELADVAPLPGMIRAVARTLARVWQADLDIEGLTGQSERFADLALIQRRVRLGLPAGALIPPDLSRAALNRISNAAARFSSVTVDRLSEISAVWRPLLQQLAGYIPVDWAVLGTPDHSWFRGTIAIQPERAPLLVEGDLCADPRAEVVEALRWARAILSRGGVQANEIGFCTATPASWDDHFLVLSNDAGLPVHFSHGVPALSSRDGQTCAALADILMNGLSQDRVRRLFRRLSYSGGVNVPADWSTGLARRASLFTVEHWASALRESRGTRTSGEAAEQTLLPILSLLDGGIAVAGEVGQILLHGAALGLWQSALRSAPAAAIALSLQALRASDDRDPANSIVWGPVSHFTSAPRRYMRLLGLSGRTWPRAESEDPLLPDHHLPRRQLDPISITERDRRAFQIILNYAGGEVALSRSRRSAEGSLLSPSSPWPRDVHAKDRNRARIPDHAFSEGDRLLARPKEAGQASLITSSRLCWRNMRKPELSVHDGLIQPAHPVVVRALAKAHSTTSLGKLLRDPLGFLWQYGLGWRSIALVQVPLELDPLAFGELVHELMRRTVDSLEPSPGFARATPEEIEDSLQSAVEAVAELWPLERPVPPGLLWRHTLGLASQRCLRGLTVDEQFQPGTRSWTELSFGQTSATHDTAIPWDVTADVVVPGTDLLLSGRIDRIDLTAAADAIRISDYKSGKIPKNSDRIIVAQGTEVQRVLYAMAARRLLPDVRHRNFPAGLSRWSVSASDFARSHTG